VNRHVFSRCSVCAWQVHRLDLDGGDSEEVCREAARSLPGLECLRCTLFGLYHTKQSTDRLLRRLEAFAAPCGQLRQLRVLMTLDLPEDMLTTLRQTIRTHQLVRSWAGTRQLRCFVDYDRFPKPFDACLAS